ncbi:hypothetical protein ACFWOT_30150 [Streptomyces sp. NPDC058440]
MYEDEVDELVAAAPCLLRNLPPLLALRTWLDRLVRFGRSTQELADT